MYVEHKDDNMATMGNHMKTCQGRGLAYCMLITFLVVS
jgi:hypothetical protein